MALGEPGCIEPLLDERELSLDDDDRELSLDDDERELSLESEDDDEDSESLRVRSFLFGELLILTCCTFGCCQAIPTPTVVRGSCARQC